MEKIKEFIVLYAADCRRRHCHRQIREKIKEFCVQLEIFYKGRWFDYIRYDTSHGFTHRDVIHIDGRKEKVPLGIEDFNEALTFAQIDIDSNWRLYRERFFKEVSNEK